MADDRHKKIIEDTLGVSWQGRTYDVHHINHDHNDNRIENLVVIPRKLHHKYHYLYKIVSEKCFSITNKEMKYADKADKSFEVFARIKNDIVYIYHVEMNAISLRQKYVNFDVSGYLQEKLINIFEKYGDKE